MSYAPNPDRLLKYLQPAHPSHSQYSKRDLSRFSYLVGSDWHGAVIECIYVWNNDIYQIYLY